MKYIFGPVSSRRFGMSLGIDLSPNEKCCNFDCIYCELKKAPKTDKIVHPPKVLDIIEDVKRGLNKYDVDVVTITANGEPTLYPNLDELVNAVNEIKGEKKSLILSNASTIMKKNIQNALKKLDIVKLSLDCVHSKIFQKIDRPIDKIRVEEIIKGIKEFSKIFHGELVIEVLVVKNINDKNEDFVALNEVFKQINPTRIDISTIDRPPAYNVEPVEYERLFELSKAIKNQHIFIASRKNLANKRESYSREELLQTFIKRPFSEDDIKNILDDASRKIFFMLVREGLVKEKIIANTRFYTA